MPIREADKKAGEIQEWMRADVGLLTNTIAKITKVTYKPVDYTTRGEKETGITRVRDIDEGQREIHRVVDRIVTEMDLILALIPRVGENIDRGYMETDIDEALGDDDEDNDNNDDDDYDDREDGDGDEE